MFLVYILKKSFQGACCYIIQSAREFVWSGSRWKILFNFSKNCLGSTLGRISPKCLLKVDLKEANCSIYSQVMQGLGFPVLLISWIKECITIVLIPWTLMGDCLVSLKVKWIKKRRSTFSSAVCHVHGMPIKVTKERHKCLTDSRSTLNVGNWRSGTLLLLMIVCSFRWVVPFC